VKIHLARDLELPLTVVTQRLAFMGRSGSGKTYAAGKLAEEMLEAGAQVVVLDPVGNWYGLRLAAGGGRGIAIPVLGGDQGDVPLEPAAGALVADTIVDRGISAVVDVSRFRKGQRVQFVTDFAEQLFHRKKGARTPMHLIVEEAHVFIPQRTMHGQERLLGAMEDLVRLGRNYGIGVSLLSQRPQSVNKDALNQTEILLALQLTGPQERAAIEAWIEGHGLELPDGQDFVRELPGLHVGEAWIWSPQFLRVLKRVKILKKRTFDASATPDASSAGAAAPVKPLGKDDLEALRGAMADVVKRAEADDPKALRKRIVELERELAAARAAQPEMRVERVEVPVLTKELAARIDAACTAFIRSGEAACEELGRVWRGATKALDSLQGVHAPAPRKPATPEERATRPAPSAGQVSARGAPRAARAGVAVEGIVGGARRMLEVLAAFPAGRTRTQLATLAGMSPKSGTFSTYLGRLRGSGLVEGDRDLLVITAAGLEAAGGAWPAPTPEEVQALWLPQLVGGCRAMLEHLLDIWPKGLSRDGLAEAVGLSPGSGTFSTYLGRLRGNALVEQRDGLLFASDDLVT
jgi:hypothetical protein